METDIHSPIRTNGRLLVCDSITSSGPALEAIRAQGYGAVAVNAQRPLSSEVGTLLASVDVVLLDVSMASHDFLYTLDEINAAIGICSIRPRVLCFSTVHRDPLFIASVRRCGAQYARINDLAMLIESIDLLLTEMNELQRNGPCFRIVHRFSQGNCAPGEEISAVFLVQDDNVLQFPLGLAQRLVFDFLAHRRIAVDSLQIVSGLAGDWFYREHAANSGQRQAKKVRRATVKVLVQRIREAMSSTFRKARLGFDPAEVLRSCSAEGSKRVLYKLHAGVRWHHVTR